MFDDDTRIVSASESPVNNVEAATVNTLAATARRDAWRTLTIEGTAARRYATGRASLTALHVHSGPSHVTHDLPYPAAHRRARIAPVYCPGTRTTAALTRQQVRGVAHLHPTACWLTRRDDIAPWTRYTVDNETPVTTRRFRALASVTITNGTE